MTPPRSRRSVLTLTTTTGLAGLAGCVGGLLDDVTTFSASPAEVSDTGTDETGYQHEGTESMTEEREFAGETVEVTNYIAEYHRTIDLPALDGDQEAAVFATISSPQVGVAGQQFNPLDDMATHEVVELIQEQYDGLAVGDQIDDRSVDTLGQTVTVDVFEGEATFIGEMDLDVRLDVTTPDHGDDHLVIVGVYPDFAVDDTGTLPDESDNVDTLIRELEHEG